ncbi:hypothetical protein DPMN_066671 [Dreissena polymorpha]|uniref:Uncharacterized protein n=1 Tax=Dreissena polymorpha TaxID=45954 RepID=A0A9D4BS86_DREPO|nr:hypothetical protein DPMN_066671 [Dreissena polymorpha]
MDGKWNGNICDNAPHSSQILVHFSDIDVHRSSRNCGIDFRGGYIRSGINNSRRYCCYNDIHGNVAVKYYEQMLVDPVKNTIDARFIFRT